MCVGSWHDSNATLPPFATYAITKQYSLWQFALLDLPLRTPTTQRRCRITRLTVFPSSTMFSFTFVFRHRHKNCPPSTYPNRDRRRRDFIDVFLPKIVRTYCDTIHLPVAIVNRHTVCITSVRFVAPFFPELQQRKCTSLRFFKAVAVCSSTIVISAPFTPVIYGDNIV